MVLERSVEQVVGIEHEILVVEVVRHLSAVHLDADLLDAEERGPARVAREIRVKRRQDVLAILGVDAAEPAGVIHLGKDKGILAVPCRQVVAVHVLREDESVTERALDVYVPQSLLGVAPQPGTDEAGRIMTVRAVLRTDE